ncbi:hypothetical protein [Gluconobacter sp. Gdi]|uniref:hypothetical protein n=1 Tax=Gluconobacter sp. Gdi TaxID=2691888 RepID=UPI00176A4217|nr:hypothetical protein [Gluconobacter sp. Gdi]GFE96572.1 hypothetical protein DmGdi_16450 [Gluconobacter sp. Gdi]
MAKSVLKGSARVQAQLNRIGRELQGGWMKRLLSRVLRRTQALPHANIGFLEGAVYPDGTPLATVAYYNEFGTDRIPARPFMRQAIAKNQDQWPKLLAASLKATRGDLEKALDMTAERIVGQIQASIEKGTYEPDSPVTNLLKDRFPKREQSGMTPADVWQAMRDVRNGATAPAAKPLDWTGDLYQNVNKEVVSD